jgi:hypothetical protein
VTVHSESRIASTASLLEMPKSRTAVLPAGDAPAARVTETKPAPDSRSLQRVEWTPFIGAWYNSLMLSNPLRRRRQNTGEPVSQVGVVATGNVGSSGTELRGIQVTPRLMIRSIIDRKRP